VNKVTSVLQLLKGVVHLKKKKKNFCW